MLIKNLIRNNSKSYKQYITKRFRVYLDAEDGMYLRRYYWNMKISQNLYRDYTCEPFEFGWIGNREDMDDWSRWYKMYVTEKKPKNPILFWLHSAFIEPFDIEIFLYHDFMVAQGHNNVIASDIAKGHYHDAAWIARSLEKDVDTYLTMYFFDVEHPIIGPFIIDYIVSWFLWDFVLDWGLSAYVMFIDIRWGIKICWNFCYSQGKIFYAYILTLIS
jgi:hypothetical protein